MSGLFDGATSQLSAPVALATAIPFTVGMWSVPTSTNAGELCFITDVAKNNYFEMIQGGGNWGVGCTQAGVAAQTFGGTVNINTPYFLLWRFITATNRRLDIWDYNNNAITSIQNTTSKTPVTPTQTGIGADSTGATFFAGNIQEFWLANIDVMKGGGVTDITLLYQLALHGPWSVPIVANAVQQYNPFIQTLGTGGMVQGENYSRGKPPFWTNANTVLAPQFAPLSPNYLRPSDTILRGMF